MSLTTNIVRRVEEKKLSEIFYKEISNLDQVWTIPSNYLVVCGGYGHVVVHAGSGTMQGWRWGTPGAAGMRLQQQPMGAAVEALARRHPCSRLALFAAAPIAAIKAIVFFLISGKFWSEYQIPARSGRNSNHLFKKK